MRPTTANAHLPARTPPRDAATPAARVALRRASVRDAAAGGGREEGRAGATSLPRAAVNRAHGGDAPPAVRDVLRSPGRPLDPAARAFMEPRFGHDFSRVRVHTDATAAESARAAGALAYTVGSQVVFGAGQYRHDLPGLFLLAHELAHVAQAERAGPAAPTLQAALDGGRGDASPLKAAASASSPAERQADRMARAVVSGAAISETPVPAAGIHLQTPGNPPPAPPPTRPAAPPHRTLAQLLVEWSEAGLLSPPFRPADVAEFPQMEVSEQQAQAAGLPTVAAAGVAAPALRPPTAPAPAPARPPLRLVPPPAPPAASAVTRALGGLRFLGPIAVGLTVLLTPTETAPPWMDELNQITGLPYSSPEEYRWVRRLTPSQADYLRRLNRARRISPDPALENDPAPTDLPTPMPVPQPAPRPDRRGEQEPCFAANVPRRGGHARHDAYATKVSGSPLDYFVRTPTRAGGLAITYDGLQPTSMVWEVKVGFGWFFSAAHSGLRDTTLARFDAQKDRGLAVARACNYMHLWSIPDRWVAGLLTARWGGTPPVLSIPE